MPLRPLVATTCLHVYYDAFRDVLFLDLEGQLTRAEVQAISEQITQLARHRRYSQVIINAGHFRFAQDCPVPWFVQLLVPALNSLGVHQLAWVCRASPSSLTAGHLLFAHLAIPTSLFADAEHAATWLCRYSDLTKWDILLPAPTTSCLLPVTFGSPATRRTVS